MRSQLSRTLIALLLFAPEACAQDISCPPMPAPIASGPPVLNLSAQATIKLPPDMLVADMTALASLPTAIGAQRRVNSFMAQASKAADGVAGVKATFKDYSVAFIEASPLNQPSHWTAQQTVEIKGQSSEALLDLVGRLQALGLVIGDLEWQVSAERAEKARQDATMQALKTLRTQASDDAAALGLQVDRFGSVRLNEEARPFPLVRAAMKMTVAMAAAMPPPNATAEQQDVTATVSADVVLRMAADDRNPKP